MPNSIRMNPICSKCESLLRFSVRFPCEHRQCRACIVQSPTGRISCAICGTDSWPAEVVEDREMATHIEDLPVECLECHWSGSMRDYQMHSEQVHPSAGNSISFTSQLYATCIYCSLYEYGCTHGFHPAQLEQHNSSEQHAISWRSMLRSHGEKFESLSVEYRIHTLPWNALLYGELKEVTTKVFDFYGALVSSAFSMETPNTQRCILDALPKTVPNSSNGGGRQAILNADRNQNADFDLASYQAQYRANEAAKKQLTPLISRRSSRSELFIDMKQEPRSSGSHPSQGNETRQVPSEETPFSSAIHNTYHLNDMKNKLANLANVPITLGTEPETSTNQALTVSFQHRSPKRSVSCCAQLKDPAKGSFHGAIKITLFDQNATNAPKHITRELEGELNTTNKTLLLTEFISMDELYAEGSGLIVNDHMHVSVEITPRSEAKLFQLSAFD